MTKKTSFRNLGLRILFRPPKLARGLRLWIGLHIRTCVAYMNACICYVDSLPRLLLEFRIRFKLACLTYKPLSTSKPTYLHALLTPYTPPRCLRSSGTRLLAEPRCRTVMGSRAFHFSAPREWN